MQLQIGYVQQPTGGSNGSVEIRVITDFYGRYEFLDPTTGIWESPNSADGLSHLFSNLPADNHNFRVRLLDEYDQTIDEGNIYYTLGTVHPPIGTHLHNDCNGYNLQQKIADGEGGFFWGDVVEYNSTSCGFVSEPEEPVEEPVEEPTEPEELTLDDFTFEDAPLIENSFTASYSIDGKYWVSDEHDYIPNLYLSNQKRLASFQNGKFYKHNDKNSVCKFYEGIIYPSSMDMVFPIGAEAVLHSLSWEADAIGADGQVNHDETFDTAIVYTNAQCSGEVELKRFKGMRDVLGVWRFNEFVDMVRDRNQPFMIDGILIPSNIKTRAAWFNKSLFINKFFIVRLIHNNQSQNNLYIYKADVVVSKSVR